MRKLLKNSKNLIGSLALASSLIFSGCNKQEENLERYLVEGGKKIEYSIPEVEKVENYFVPNSKDTLVLIRQYHPVLGGIGKLEQRLETNKVQKNIYKILEDSYNKGAIQNLYVEGITEKNISKVNEQLHKEKLYSKNSSLDKLNLSNSQQIKQLASASVFSINYNFPLEITESERIVNKAVKILKKKINKNKNLNSDKWIFTKREDFIIKNIAENNPEGKGNPFLLFGARHDFRDNLSKWNNKHSSKKYSLIVITPKGVNENYKQLN
jgi:hypothetical protein